MIYENRQNRTSTSELEISGNLLIGKFSHHLNNSVAVWQKDTGLFLYSQEYNRGKIVMSETKLIVYKEDENVINIFNKQDGSPLFSIAGIPPKSWNIQVFENLLIIPSLDNHLQIRNIDDGALLHTISAHTRNFSLDGSHLIAYDTKKVADVLVYDLSVLVPSL